MIKRLFWLTVGMFVGTTGSFWLMVKARERIARWRPEQVSADVSSAVRTFGDDVRAAVADGRAAMARREAEIRDAVTPGG
ncbi:MAG: hypothetical protein AB7L84_15935 [Acidimicrobiia bacterium]